MSQKTDKEPKMAHPNEDLLRRGYEAFAAGDIDTVLSLFAHEIAWQSGGSNQTSGEYHGHQEVVELLHEAGGVRAAGRSAWTSTTSWPTTRMAPCS